MWNTKISSNFKSLSHYTITEIKDICKIAIVPVDFSSPVLCISDEKTILDNNFLEKTNFGGKQIFGKNFLQKKMCADIFFPC